MTLTVEPPVAKKRPTATPPTPDDKPAGTTPLAVSSDVVAWINTISRYAYKKAKESGIDMGKKKVRNAVIADPFLRQAIWKLKVECENAERGTPNAPIPPAPRCPLEPLPVELP